MNFIEFGLPHMFMGMTKFTGITLGIMVFLSLLTTLNFASKYDLYLNWDRVFKRFEVWRLFTGIFYTSPIDLKWLLTIMNYGTTMSEIEQLYVGKKKNFYVMLSCVCIMSFIASYFFKISFLYDMIIEAIDYILCKKSPDGRAMWILFVVKSLYKPFLKILLTYLLDNNVRDLLISYTIGHIIYYLMELYPQINGADPIMKLYGVIESTALKVWAKIRGLPNKA